MINRKYTNFIYNRMITQFALNRYPVTVSSQYTIRILIIIRLKE